MHLSESCLTPLKHSFKHHFNRFDCLFTVGPYVVLPTEQGLLSLRGLTDWHLAQQTGTQRVGTLQQVEIEVHNLEETQLLVMLGGQPCQLCASYFCVQQSMKLFLDADKPLGVHVGGFSLAFTNYFVWY